MKHQQVLDLQAKLACPEIDLAVLEIARTTSTHGADIAAQAAHGKVTMDTHYMPRLVIAIRLRATLRNLNQCSLTGCRASASLRGEALEVQEVSPDQWRKQSTRTISNGSIFVDEPIWEPLKPVFQSEHNVFQFRGEYKEGWLCILVKISQACDWGDLQVTISCRDSLNQNHTATVPSIRLESGGDLLGEHPKPARHDHLKTGQA